MGAQGGAAPHSLRIRGSRTGSRFMRAPWPGVLISVLEGKLLRAQCTGNFAKLDVAGNPGEHQEPGAPEFQSELSVNKRRAGSFPASGLRSDSTVGRGWRRCLDKSEGTFLLLAHTPAV